MNTHHKMSSKIQYTGSQWNCKIENIQKETR